MLILKVISLLMDYPTEALRDGRAELAEAIANSTHLDIDQQAALRALLADIADGDLMDVQERYTELFDRGRSLSLLLFEHVHGESRDRGQAMVDLTNRYDVGGFNIGVRELPDYIPLYLEFLSTCDPEEAREGLADVAHLLAVLAARLDKRACLYSACFHALLHIAGKDPVGAVAALRADVAAEARDDSLEALDKEWEDEAVNFLQAEQQGRCSGMAPQGPTKRPADASKSVLTMDFLNKGHAAGRAREVPNV